MFPSFDSQLSSFKTYADQNFPLGSLISPVSATPGATVSPASMAGSVAGAVANAATGGVASVLFNTRAVAFILGLLLIGAALLIFAFQGAEKGVEIVAGGRQRANALKEGVATLAA